MKIVEVNSSVTVNYTGRLNDGSIFDSSLTEGREPLNATLGQGSLIPGFEKGLLGMKECDKKTVDRSRPVFGRWCGAIVCAGFTRNLGWSCALDKTCRH